MMCLYVTGRTEPAGWESAGGCRGGVVSAELPVPRGWKGERASGRRGQQGAPGSREGQVGACRVARPGGRVPEGADTRSLVSRAAETWRRLACPRPALGGELPLPQGTGPCRLQWGRTRLSGVSRGWVCLRWVWHLSRFVTQNQTRSWTTFTCCMKAKLCWKTNPAKNQS